MSELENKTTIIKSFITTLFDSAIIVAVITSVMYLISYLYMKGFYSYYGLIDLEINFTLFRVLKTCIEIFISLLNWIIIYLVISIPLAKSLNEENENFVWTILFFWLLCLVFIRTAVYSKEIKQKVFNMSIPITMIIIIVAFYIWYSRLSDDKTKDLQKDIDNIKFFKSIPWKILGFLCWGLTIINFVPKYGYQQAEKKSDYLIDTENQRILIYNDAEKSIFLKNNNDSFEYKYIIISNSDLSQITFEHYNKRIIFQNESIKDNEDSIEAVIYEQSYEEIIDNDLLDPIN